MAMLMETESSVILWVLGLVVDLVLRLVLGWEAQLELMWGFL